MKKSSGQTIIPLALLALVALVGGLVYHARALETSHRATAESALRDYAAMAAWQYTQRLDNLVGSAANITLSLIQHPYLHRAFRDDTLPGVDALVKFGNAEACGLMPDARFAFRLDLPARRLHVAGAAPDADVQRAIADRFSAIAADTSHRSSNMRMFVDTVGGAARAIAYGIVFSRDSQPRAVYGVEADPAALAEYIGGIPSDSPVLPPSLLRGQPIDSFITVSVHRADGGVLTMIGEPTSSPLVAVERSGRRAGLLTTRVAVRADAASALLIGGVPDSRLGLLLLLLAGSVVVAGVALWQTRRARELSRLRSRFVASVSHELRTPLAQISMFSETLLLRRERSREEGQEFLTVIFREARRLSHLVESVLRFARAEAAASLAPLHLEPSDVSAEVADAVRAFRPLAVAADVTLHTAIEEGARASVDRDALRQIVVNLLDNALKFGPRGQAVDVRVWVAAGNVQVRVTDQGPGVAAAERERVFTAFVQGAAGQSRASTGAGIGLAVVADLVAAHGGRVWIDDGPDGVGASACVSLPAFPADDDAAPPRDPVHEEHEVFSSV